MRLACVVCGEPFDAARANAKYCGERCKKRAQRKPGVGDAVVVLPSLDQAPGRVEKSCRAELDTAGVTDSALGVAAIFLAQRLDESGARETGAGVSALMKQYRETLAEATKNADAADDALEEIHASAALKLIRGGRSA